MSDQTTITVNVPISFERRRGRKRLVAPDGTELAMASQSAKEVDETLVKAIARAHRWQRMLESGEFGTIRDLAKAERLDAAYISRMLKLTLLPPVTVEAILEGRQPKEVTLKTLMLERSSVWPACALDRCHNA
jgi:ParB-like chromosome segregation protein Spo0J